MRQAGLTPSRYDKTDVVEYMKPTERKRVETYREKYAHAVATEKRTFPIPGSPVKFISTETFDWVYGIVGGKVDASGKMWGIAIDENGDSFRKVNVHAFFEVRPDEKGFVTQKLMLLAARVKVYLENKRTVSRLNRGM